MLQTSAAWMSRVHSRGKIVVIAADGSLRRSFEFGLFAEGFIVRAFSNVGQAEAAKAMDGALCVVLDDTAMPSRGWLPALHRLADRLVITSGGIVPVPDCLAADTEILDKPLRDGELTAAIARLPATLRSSPQGHTEFRDMLF